MEENEAMQPGQEGSPEPMNPMEDPEAAEMHAMILKAHEIISDPEKMARVKALAQAHREGADVIDSLDKLREVAKKKIAKKDEAPNDTNKKEMKEEKEE